MPQLHHRDPSIIGLLGASPHLSSPVPNTPATPSETPGVSGSALNKAIGALKPSYNVQAVSEAFDDLETPPLTPVFGAVAPRSRGELHLEKGMVADLAFERPFYGMIVDGIHSHPNSVRVCTVSSEPSPGPRVLI